MYRIRLSPALLFCPGFPAILPTFPNIFFWLITFLLHGQIVGRRMVDVWAKNVGRTSVVNRSIVTNVTLLFLRYSGVALLVHATPISDDWQCNYIRIL
ncbi:hypothetical protein DFH06DRAFT_1216524 [Mycena polygramma]|nr:hypothetical protein DFH06DRAFT_1216524 [Mycena polygramma]